ncbi:MAG: bifunctional phosphoribosylaminoimidazolecarboxamide formyltransferase/IMP cyclohydrolase [Melioribacteraceae bacterium]|nr:bifunctional phosphoribosylaminoimidazolecarboxamide formyltransferase/IMP cyclohydrolase [Melioribacteraceae bacterium]
MKKFALLSVSDKTGIVEFAANLIEHGYEILATGNTARVISENKIECTLIEKFTNFPEIFDGRVKTLQPSIFGGILMRRDNKSDQVEAEKNNIVPIDIVCVNLYPFVKVSSDPNADLDTKIENIDIGGPSLVRAAAKNYKHVSILTSPEQYSDFVNELAAGNISEKTRKKLAYEAFSHTAKYDTFIANFFEKEFDQPATDLRINYELLSELRYGENPHQQAQLYGNFYDYVDVLHGKELSYNNIVDLIAAVEIIQDLSGNSCVIVKHTNASGAAVSDDLLDAYEKALSGDPVSAFGGIVAFNGTVTKNIAVKLNEIFLEIVCAHDFDSDALELLKQKKNRRLIKIKKPLITHRVIKEIPGGIISQNYDSSSIDDLEFNIVTKFKPSQEELEDLKFAWVICKHTKSNAIVFVKDKKVIGVGAGQMSRLDSAKIAASKAKEHGHNLEGAVAASDAFFPFADGIIEIANAGIKSIIQPGGSVRDEEVIEAADEKNISMVFTGIRNFKH